MITEFTQPEKRLLLIFFALEPAFQRKVKSVPPSVDGWHPIHESPYRVMWRAISSILDKSGQFGPILPELIMAEMSADPDAAPILNSGNMLALNEVNNILETIQVYSLAALSTHLKCVLEILQRFFDVRLALATANKFQGSTLNEQVGYLQDQLSMYKTAGLRQSTFMLPTMPVPSGTLIREEFGEPWLDDLTGGGMADGDAMLFIAPSGGGKTVFGTQISWRRAQRGRHAVYCSYEQETDTGDILLRYFAMATGIPRSEFEGKSMAEMPIEVQHKFQEAREAAGVYTHIYDMSGSEQGWGGVSDYYEIVKDERAAGRPPTLLVVDWVQTAVLRYMGAQGIPEIQLSQRMDTFTREFAMLCRDEHIQGVLLQQMDTASQRKKNVEPHFTLAAMCKSMGNYCRYALGLPRLSKEKYGFMYRTKSTSYADDNNTEMVWLNGALNQFERAPDNMQFDERSRDWGQRANVPGGAHAHSIDR